MAWSWQRTVVGLVLNLLAAASAAKPGVVESRWDSMENH
jgi:hypothetical protein